MFTMLGWVIQVIVVAACVDIAIIIREKRKKDGEMEEEDI